MNDLQASVRDAFAETLKVNVDARHCLAGERIVHGCIVGARVDEVLINAHCSISCCALGERIFVGNCRAEAFEAVADIVFVGSLNVIVHFDVKPGKRQIRKTMAGGDLR